VNSGSATDATSEISAQVSAALDSQRAHGGPTSFDATQEMRFAVVMFGGVSLAIYINGVARELLALVRATAPSAPGSSTQALLTPEELSGTERVYRLLGQLVSWHGPTVDAAGTPTLPAPEDPILTRFVVDVVSGTSAGGINGVFLAKALTNHQPLDQLRKLWVDEAAIESLVNDPSSLLAADGSPLSGLAPLAPAQSVLNSRRMYRQILSALHDMTASEPGLVDGRSCLVDELDLYLTTTDLEGLELPIDLFDKVVYERRFRNVFRFVYATEESTGGDRNDFERPNDPFLAYAARCTSAFPFAFEPMTLEDIDTVVGQFAGYAGIDSSSDWERFLPDYIRAARSNHSYDLRPWRTTAFGDGGYLDNKPFSYATERLARRHETVPVDRRLIYVEPDPRLPPIDVNPGTPQPPAGRPNALDNSYAAKAVLPRAETIREDIERILERNRELARITRLTEVADDVLNLDWNADSLVEWRDLSLASGPLRSQYRAYRRLKVSSVLDDLADVVGRLLRLSEGAQEAPAIRYVIEAWADPDVEAVSHDSLLSRFDFSFRLRRLTFLLSRIDRLLKLLPPPPPFDEGWEAPGGEERDAYLAILQAIKRELSSIFVQLRRAGREVRSPSARPDLEELLRAVGI